MGKIFSHYDVTIRYKTPELLFTHGQNFEDVSGWVVTEIDLDAIPGFITIKTDEEGVNFKSVHKGRVIWMQLTAVYHDVDPTAPIYSDDGE